MSRVPARGVTETGWQDESHHVILIGTTTNPMREDAKAKSSMDLLEPLRKRGMEGDVDFLREAL